MNVLAHLNHIAFSHSVFSLPFAYMAAFLAAGGVPDVKTLFFITVAILSARAAAVSVDNLVDYKYDKKQERLGYRALVSGKLSMKAAKIATVLYLIIFFTAVLKLPIICLKLLPLALIIALIYPFTKRYTFLCHFFLGLAIAVAPAGAWIAVKGTIDPVDTPMLVLCAGVALWIGMFDAIYGAQDEKFDLSQGLHSLSTEFGAKTALKIAWFFHVVSVILFFIVGIMCNLSWIYFVGVGAASGVLRYQHEIVKYNDFSRVTQKYFMKNGLVSVLMFIFTWLSL